MLKRVFAENRLYIILLAVVLAANAGFYLAVTYPVTARAEGATRRAASARQGLAAAERDYETARATETGKGRAEVELKKFYREVLPADLAAARRMASVDLSRIAEESHVQAQRQSMAQEDVKDSSLVRLHVTMELQGDYENLRQFLYRVETSPDFLVIDNVALTQSADQKAQLRLALAVSTYYRARNDGA